MSTQKGNKNFPVGKLAYWLLLIFVGLLLLMLLIGQTGSLISYEFAVKLGLQESAATISQFGIAMNRGFAVADTIIYVPLAILAIIGFLRRRRWGLLCMAGVMGITAYWPIVCLLTLIFARGAPGFYFQDYVAYTILLGTITILAAWGFVYLCKVVSKKQNNAKEVVLAWVAAFNQADAKKIAEFYAEDAINHQITQDPVSGKQNIYAMFKAEFAKAKMQCIVENIFEADEWAMLEWKDPVGLRGCGFFHIVNGKIAFQRGYWDKLSFLRLHGLPISE